MKRTISFLVALLFGLTALYPAGVILTALFGYRFTLISIPGFSAVIAFLAVAIIILEIINKKPFKRSRVQKLLIFLLPLSFVNGVFYMFKCPQIWVIACTVVSFVCCGYLAAMCLWSLPAKIVVGSIATLMTFLLCIFSFFIFLFGNIGQNTVVQTVESPGGKYYAQVIDSDQGALGGDTIVYVYKSSKLNAILFQIQKKPQRVYTGDWGEFRTMRIQWKNDRYLIINSVEYPINP